MWNFAEFDLWGGGQYTVVAYKFDCAVWNMEGFSATEDNSMVAICYAYTLIYCFPRRPSPFVLENI